MALLRTRAVAVWLILVGATIGSLTLVEAFRSPTMNRTVSTVVIAVAFIKVRFVGLDFMELRRAPFALRLVFELWLIVIGGTLIILYWSQT
jgi:hypothetical protein